MEAAISAVPRLLGDLEAVFVQAKSIDKHKKAGGNEKEEKRMERRVRKKKKEN